MPRSLIPWTLIFLVVLGKEACAANRLFGYYSPLSSRSFGIGGAGSADLADHTNVAANPATIAFLRGATVSLLYAPFSVPPLDFDYSSTFFAIGTDARVSTSTVANFAIGGAFRHDQMEVSVPGISGTKDDTYNAFFGVGLETGQMRIGGIADPIQMMVLEGQSARELDRAELQEHEQSVNAAENHVRDFKLMFSGTPTDTAEPPQAGGDAS